MIGKTLAHYEILEKIGAGGMGEVWRARDTKLGRDVALKILPAEMASDPARLQRFEREARTVAGLSHPHIVTLFSVEEADGVRFFTMELVKGRSLAELLTPEGLPPARVLSIGIAVADALSAAHEKGVAHRDIKPANVMIAAGDRVKVLDFGLARPIETEPSENLATQALPLTVEGAVVGTVPYMSPEQLRGREVDHRSDIFSLGVLLYELTTGRRPFGGATNADLMSSILTETPAEVCRLKPDLPSRLGTLIGRCLEKSPGDRHATAAEVRDELVALRAELESGRTVAPGVAPADPPPSPARKPAMAGLRAIAVVTAILVLGAVAVFQLRDRPPGPDTPKTIAVLPFENLSPDESDAFFTTGVHEDVMTALGRLQDLRVISRTSVLVAQRDAGTLRELGDRLGARFIVEGSVRRWENQVRVTAQLIDAETDQSLWSDTYDHELRDVLAVQSAIARDIATTLRATLSPDEKAHLSDTPTVVVAAYDEYLKARNLLNASRVPLDALRQAVRHLTVATATDPAFADGWALLSRAQSDLTERLRELDDREDDAEAAAAAAETALERAEELAPGSAAALKAKGYFHQIVRDDPVTALRALDQALALNPNDAETLQYQSQIYFSLGQVDASVDALEKAYAIDGANGRLIFFLTFMYELTGRYSQMVPFLERLARLEPERTHLPVQAKYYRFLADGSLESFRALEEAVRTVERTESCDVRSVQDREMLVAMVNGEFESYSQAWAGKWDRHQEGHGNWACPAIINDEANHAHLELQFGDPARAAGIVARAKSATTRPYTEMSMCIFDRTAFEPKLDFMSGDSLAARRAFEESVPAILGNQAFPRGAVERFVLLQTADMVAPDRVYSLYREIVARPGSMVRMEVVCANPWTYPNLLRDPGFLREVREDGRFVEFLEHYDLIPAPADS